MYRGLHGNLRLWTVIKTPVAFTCEREQDEAEKL